MHTGAYTRFEHALVHPFILALFKRLLGDVIAVIIANRRDSYKPLYYIYTGYKVCIVACFF